MGVRTELFEAGVRAGVRGRGRMVDGGGAAALIGAAVRDYLVRRTAPVDVAERAPA